MFTGITLPFSPSDLVLAGNGLLALVGTFILIALTFPLAQIIIGIIRHAFYTREALGKVGNLESRKKFKKQLWSRHEIKHSIRMQFKGDWNDWK